MSTQRLVVTIAIGDEIASFAKYTLPTIQAYAEKVGADFTLLEETEISEKFLPTYEKNQIRHYLDSYQNVLYIDADILVTPDAPDLFDLCPADKVGVVSVDQVYAKADEEKALLKQELGDIDWVHEYFNAGVMMFSDEHKHMANTTDGIIDKWVAAKAKKGIKGLNDQSVFNYRVNKLEVPLYYLDQSFNFTKAWGCFERRFANYFIHYAGLKGNRVTRIRLDSSILRRPLAYRLFKRFPVLTRLFDSISLRLISSPRTHSSVGLAEK